MAFLEGFLALTPLLPYPQIWSNIAKIPATGSAPANKSIVWNFLKDFKFLWRRDWPKVSTCGPILTLLFPMKMVEIEENKQLCRRTSAIGLPKYVKINFLSPLPFPGKIRLLFAIFRLFLPGNRVKSQVRGLESKFDRSFFIHTIPVQLPVKKSWFKHSPVLQL